MTLGEIPEVLKPMAHDRFVPKEEICLENTPVKSQSLDQAVRIEESDDKEISGKAGLLTLSKLQINSAAK